MRLRELQLAQNMFGAGLFSLLPESHPRHPEQVTRLSGLMASALQYRDITGPVNPHIKSQRQLRKERKAAKGK